MNPHTKSVLLACAFVPMCFYIGSSLTMAQETSNAIENEVCTGSWRIFEPSPTSNPNSTSTSTVRLEYQSYSSPDDRCVKNAISDQIEALGSHIKKTVIEHLNTFPKSFEFVVVFTLTQNSPATMKIDTKNLPTEARQPLTKIYGDLSRLKDFHSKFGTVYLTMHYKIGQPN